MSEEFTIQCPACGTYYNDLQDLCPYCGQPHPALADEQPLIIEEVEDAPPEPDDYNNYVDDPTPAEAPYPTQPLPNEEEDIFVDDNIFAVAGEDAPPEQTLDPAPDDFYAADEYDEPLPPGYEYDDEAGLPPGEELPLPPPPAGYVSPQDFGAVGTPEDFVPPPDEALLPEEANNDDETFDEDDAPPARRSPWRRAVLGCLGLFICGILFYSGLGILAVRNGLQERAELAFTESQQHYERGQTLLTEESYELAIAEFERALKLNPSFQQARQALRDTQRISQQQPTPTSQTRSAAAAELLAQAESQFEAEEWATAIQTLSQVRDLDANYQPARVSEMLYEASYTWGQQLLTPEQAGEALTAFDQALQERPEAPDAVAARAKVALYVSGVSPETNAQSAVRLLTQLYREDEDYLDVTEQLVQAYENFADELRAEEEWCLAENQYSEALEIEAGRVLSDKLEEVSELCADTSLVQIRPTATPRNGSATADGTPDSVTAAGDAETDEPLTGNDEETEESADAVATDSPAAANSGSSAGGQILFSAYNQGRQVWEVMSIPAAGGTPETLVTEATMPALSPNGNILLYRSERIDSEGLHSLDLSSGQDIRATIYGNHIFPRWSGDNLQFIFTAQDPGTGRWQIFQGFADGKGDPVILGDGRTPDWSDDGSRIAFQGTDRQGNNPGIYLMPFGGGDTTRLTTHESDRSPAFSPNGRQIAFMTTRNGNWDIYLANTTGGEARQFTSTPGNEGLPAWSPGGQQLAYVSDAGGQWAIYTINRSGGTPQKVIEWDGAQHTNWLTAQIWWSR